VVLVKIEVGMVLGKMVVVLSVACCAIGWGVGCCCVLCQNPLCGGCCAENQQQAAGENNSSQFISKKLVKK